MLRSDARENLDRILGAARQVFAEQGLDAKLADVAARAGVGVGTVYRRFENKDALIAALFDSRLEVVVEKSRAALEFEDPLEGLVWFLDVSTQLMADDRALRDLAVGGPATPHAHLSQATLDRVEKLRYEVHEHVQRLVARGQAAGVVRDDLDATDIGLLSSTLQAAVDPGADSEPDVWRRVLGLVVDGLRTDGVRTPLAPRPLTEPQLSAVMRRVKSPADPK
ncbi:TetR/AcrR family transcriptional regulator [Rhodococcus rhodnii]|uniref:HTH tetR-type domain-containing protein n=2 Tax=Rhodococcus rhodnii TaxID=38312 RepID=R7WN64_9NOCA|nr:TetR/AcrR family transcriptional regulator [Rhodococcus rhodnii]EOM76761.1 hypothetical protein Rrhod_1881 [Rhodococcus rhodnii LMG 5362]TXG90057.1 TetR/AcrR family transcriptional regulator [Rhodococcus rhodnii]